METFKIMYKLFAGVTVFYTVHQLLEDKANELVDEGGIVNAFAVGAGQAGISMAAGTIAARVLG